jgi:hypothetical protein
VQFDWFRQDSNNHRQLSFQPGRRFGRMILRPSFTMNRRAIMMQFPPEKLKCRRGVNPQKKAKHHGR